MNALSASPVWQNAGSWRSVEFASDLHLCEEAPLTALAWGHWLQHTTADALFILGDLFEVWIGDDTRERPFLAACLRELRASSIRRPVFFIAGNRDFLIGPDALAAAGMQALTDPCPLTVLGHRLLLSHGDALCLADTDYQAFRQMVRTPSWQHTFLAKPLAEREAIAKAIRSDSQGRKQARPDLSAWADADTPESQRWLQAHGATTLVHGHTHRPAVHHLGDGLTRRVLPDWDMDATPGRGYVVRLDSQGWHEVPATASP